MPPAPVLFTAVLTPAAPPGNLPACQRRGFGKEAASNHSCGWDVVSILSPSFLLLPRLYQTSTQIRAAQLPLQEVQRRQEMHQLGSAARCPADPTAGCRGARNPLPTPTFNGQSEFGYDLSAARTTGLKPLNSQVSFQNDSEPAQLPPSLQRQQRSVSSRARIPAARGLHPPARRLPGVPSTPAGVQEGARPPLLASPHRPAGLRELPRGEPTRKRCRWELTTP